MNAIVQQSAGEIMEQADIELIPLCGKRGEGLYVIVDSSDAELVRQYRWFLSVQGYAIGNTGKGRKNRRTEYMHRMIAKTEPGMDTDHINRNVLDNRRANLRTATRSMNNANGKRHKNNKSPYKGVRKNNSKWEARIRCNGHQYSLGCHETPEEAARAYNKAAIEMFGEYAHLNEVRMQNDE